jgi:hypothetical protein
MDMLIGSDKAAIRITALNITHINGVSQRKRSGRHRTCVGESNLILLLFIHRSRLHCFPFTPHNYTAITFATRKLFKSDLFGSILIQV